LQRLAVLEQRVEEHGIKLAKQEDKNESQIELNTLLKLQIETSKEHSKQMEKFGDTLDRVNDNLTGLNTGMQDLNSRVTEIENNQDEKKIDLGQLAKNTILYLIPALLLAWLLIELNLK
jgi:hypothetical protein